MPFSAAASSSAGPHWACSALLPRVLLAWARVPSLAPKTSQALPLPKAGTHFPSSYCPLTEVPVQSLYEHLLTFSCRGVRLG